MYLVYLKCCEPRFLKVLYEIFIWKATFCQGLNSSELEPVDRIIKSVVTPLAYYKAPCYPNWPIDIFLRVFNVFTNSPCDHTSASILFAGATIFSEQTHRHVLLWQAVLYSTNKTFLKTFQLINSSPEIFGLTLTKLNLANNL
jgi:hypothetical protein